MSVMKFVLKHFSFSVLLCVELHQNQVEWCTVLCPKTLNYDGIHTHGATAVAINSGFKITDGWKNVEKALKLFGLQSVKQRHLQQLWKSVWEETNKSMQLYFFFFFFPDDIFYRIKQLSLSPVWIFWVVHKNTNTGALKM